MFAATRVKMNDGAKKKKSEQEHTRHFLYKTCNVLSLYKTTAKKCTKKCAVRAKLLFC